LGILLSRKSFLEYVSDEKLKGLLFEKDEESFFSFFRAKNPSGTIREKSKRCQAQEKLIFRDPEENALLLQKRKE